MLTRLGITITLSLLTPVIGSAKDSSSAPTTTVTTSGLVSAAHADSTMPDKATIELQWQTKTKKVPPTSYWMRVAECETEFDWQNKGRYAGGLGIMTSGRAIPKHFKSGAGTWERFGGEEFAPSPDKATMTQQIVVANRIATFGYTHHYSLPAGADGAMMDFTYRAKPVGYFGWGCIKNTIGKPRLKKN